MIVEVKKMEKKKVNKLSLYGICLGTSALLLGGLWYADLSQKSLKQNSPEEDYTYVSKLFDDGVTSVVSTPNLIMKPYTNADIKSLNNFYDYRGKEKDQQNAIINYDTTYIQNNGIAYGGINDTFDVVSVLPGKIASVKEDKLMGKIVTIEHDNNVITTYQSLSEITVKEGDEVAQGTVIGKAGESNLEKDLGNHVLFEISVDGKYVNPNNCYDKTIDQLKSN